MNLSEIISLFVATLVFVASPGPGVFALISSSLVNRFSLSLALCLGLIAGDMVYLSLAMFGMSKIILLFSNFFFYVQLVGGIYLIYLGLSLGLSKPQLFDRTKTQIIKKSSLVKQFTTAMLISLSNPKTILFYLGFLPAFMSLENLSLIKALQVILVIFLAAISVCLVYILASTLFKKILSSEKKAKAFNWVSGFLMAIVGVYLELRAFNLL